MIAICDLLMYIDGIVKKAFMWTNLLFHAFLSGNVHILTRACLTYIRPIVEYCTYIWSPHQTYLIDKIERVQKYFTRRVLCHTKLSHMERLSLLKLDLLEIRLIKSDLKMCFKIINGLCDIDPFHYLKFAPTSSVTRGHNIKLIKPIYNTNCQIYFFTNRVVNYWNSLPADIVNARSFGIVNHMICRIFVGAVGLRRFPRNVLRQYHFIRYLLPMQCFYFSFL